MVAYCVDPGRVQAGPYGSIWAHMSPYGFFWARKGPVLTHHLLTYHVAALERKLSPLLISNILIRPLTST